MTSNNPVSEISEEEQSYDDIPYESYPFPATQPAHVAAIATLHGLAPRDVSRARVLELGCASGGNILPLALKFPNAEFVGIDISSVQITEGLRRVAALGAKNVNLQKMSVEDISAAEGVFDYIICHGVYSWVGPSIQDALLRVCNENLSEDGVAFVSYNVLPGWHLKRIARDLMRYHTEGIVDPHRKIAAARKFLSDVRASVGGLYASAIASEADVISQAKDFYLFHDHLEGENNPVYFTEFHAHAERHGLTFLAESEYPGTEPEVLRYDVYEKIRAIAANDVIKTEQYFDFFCGRQFRKTLLVKEAQKSRITRVLRPES